MTKECKIIQSIEMFFSSFLFSASGTSAVAIDNKIEQAMVSEKMQINISS